MADKQDDPTLNLVTLAYGVAVDPEKFDDLLFAWDSWLDQAVFSPAADFDPIASIFDNAVEVSSKFTDHSDTPLTSFELASAPALLLDAQNSVVAVNTVAKNFFSQENLQVDDVVRAVSAPVPAFVETERAVFRIADKTCRRSFLAVEAPLSGDVGTAFPAANRMLVLSQIDWNESFERELKRLLNLSKAELRVARGLLEGLTAQEMADELGRSLATIRTHIKILLQKSGARRQSELIQLLTILRQTSDLSRGNAPEQEAKAEFARSNVTSEAGSLQVVRYGCGRPLLYFTTSSRPDETVSVRAALENAGFEVIAPVRPGYGNIPRLAVDANEEMLQGWLQALVDECSEPPLLVGHREGGIVAIQAASRLLAAGRDLAGVALISTGAPVQKKSVWRQSPPSIRRSFVAANHAPAALALGYQTAARLFRRGEREQEKIVRYFYLDSPVDLDKLSVPEFFAVTRDNIEYSFKDPTQVVRDIALWSSEWDRELAIVSARLNVLFVHGTEHTFFSYASVLDCARRYPNVHACPVQQAGQLALYESSDTVAAALADTFLDRQKAV
ncbi:MAG: LuxR C-terminal-related transcriptional regulator [Pseudomonadota bacterium]